MRQHLRVADRRRRVRPPSASPAASSGSVNSGGSTFIVSGDPSVPMAVERGVLGVFGEARWTPRPA